MTAQEDHKRRMGLLKIDSLCGVPTTGSNWPTFLQFADRCIAVQPGVGGSPSLQPSEVADCRPLVNPSLGRIASPPQAGVRAAPPYVRRLPSETPKCRYTLIGK
jgi:hypothetical protein